MSKRIYESSYGSSRKLTAAERLAEIACERKAQKDGGTLRQRFWEDPAWFKFFRLQQGHANGLLKAYTPAAVFKAFEARKGLFSLGWDGLVPYIEVEQKRLDAAVGQARDAAPVEAAPADSAPRRESIDGRRSMRSKLEGL